MKRVEAHSGDVLARIISTVGSSLELDEVLRAVVRLLSDASAVHACFVYLVEDDGDRLVLRAAGDPYEHLIGQRRARARQGPRWWAAERNEPAFIPTTCSTTRASSTCPSSRRSASSRFSACRSPRATAP